jgi:hypothetical protein
VVKKGTPLSFKASKASKASKAFFSQLSVSIREYLSNFTNHGY